MKCPDCRDTGKVTLATTVSDCKSCDLSHVATIRLHDSDPDIDYWPEIMRRFVELQTDELRRVTLLVCQTEFGYSIEKNHSYCPVMVNLRSKIVDGYVKRFYNIGLPHIWIEATKVIEIDGNKHIVLECWKQHEMS